MSLIVVDRFRPHYRETQQRAIDTGQLHKFEELELLNTENLQPLAMLSLIMLVVGGIFFALLTIVLFFWQNGGHFTLPSIWTLLGWVVINMLAYILILPVHELIHGLAFAFWGGKPYFGTRLPLALFCGAKNQLFPRNYYLVIGLAPFVIITLIGIICTLIWPVLTSYALFATVGNFSGSAGDVWVVRRLLHHPNTILAEDTETGFRVWKTA